MIKSIVHPSDLSVGNESAFLHGLRLALGTKGTLAILHSISSLEEADAGWTSFPGVRSALARWGLIEADAPQSAVTSQLGVRITKVELHAATPVGGVLRWLHDHSCDLVVMGTHARE